MASKSMWEDSGQPFGGQDTSYSQQTVGITKCMWSERYVLSENVTKRRARAKMIKVFLSYKAVLKFLLPSN